MITPVGYDKMWQKFEKDVFETVRSVLGKEYEVRWIYHIRELKPDVVVLAKCSGCGRAEECQNEFPIFILDAHCKWKIEKEYFAQKDEQMKKYSKICDSILVMPSGYEGWPYCKSEGGEYHIVSFHYLKDLLRSILSEAIVTEQEDVCGYTPICNASGVFKHFALVIRSRIDKCPNCRSKSAPLSLIYCSKYDEYYHPDFLDTAPIDHKGSVYTYAECSGCGDRITFGWNYDTCPYASLEYEYQCLECGAIFNSETEKIVTNFDDAHSDMLAECLPFYKDKFQTSP